MNGNLINLHLPIALLLHLLLIPEEFASLVPFLHRHPSTQLLVASVPCARIFLVWAGALFSRLETFLEKSFGLIWFHSRPDLPLYFFAPLLPKPERKEV